MKNEDAKFCQHCGNELIKRQTPVEAAMEWMKEEDAKESAKDEKDDKKLVEKVTKPAKK